jgi:hypothetical protein
VKYILSKGLFGVIMIIVRKGRKLAVTGVFFGSIPYGKAGYSPSLQLPRGIATVVASVTPTNRVSKKTGFYINRYFILSKMEV